MKTYIQFIVISLLAVFSMGKVVNADALNLSLVQTSYDYSSPASIFLDDSSMGWGLTYSMHFTPNLALDLGYTDYGSATRSFGLLNTEVETTSISLALRGSTIIGSIAGHNISAHALLGVAMADLDLTVGGTSLSDSDNGVMYGFGTSLRLSLLDEITLMYKKADLDFNNTVNFQYDPGTIELGYSRRF